MEANVHHAYQSGAEYSLYDMTFRRKFSINPYRSLRMKLGEMSFHKDWLQTDRGDPYPALFTNGTLLEHTGDGRLSVHNASEEDAGCARLLGQHFPYATYEVAVSELTDAAVGFCFAVAPGGRSAYTVNTAPTLRISMSRSGENVVLSHECTVGDVSREVITEEAVYPYVAGMRLAVTCRGRFFDVYLTTDVRPVPVLTLDVPEMADITLHGTFVGATASLWYALQPGGRFITDMVEFYLDGGVSHADMKPIRYEDGMPIITDGKIFMTMSSRLEAGGFQSVISWNPSTAEMKMEGAIFFDCGDDRWCSDVASSVLFNRYTNEWYLWACSFSHGHILCHGTSIADLRYGINVMDVTLMDCEARTVGGDSLALTTGSGESFQATLSDDRLWLAKSGDEDPDFVYDAESDTWYMTICRTVTENGKNQYRYFLFSSQEPFAGYTYLDHTRTGANTGGSIVRVGNKYYFVCGSNFHVRAQYNVYALTDLSQFKPLRCDYDDGGFRGWGTVIPVPSGSRTKYMWMTFDRHGGSTYNWSYGNIYVYESDCMNSGYERGIRYDI